MPSKPVVYELVVSTEEPLHVGGVGEGNLLRIVKLPVLLREVPVQPNGSLTIETDAPYIPASSLRGVLRSYMEQLAHVIKSAGGVVGDALSAHRGPHLDVKETVIHKYGDEVEVIVNDVQITNNSIMLELRVGERAASIMLPLACRNQSDLQDLQGKLRELACHFTFKLPSRFSSNTWLKYIASWIVLLAATRGVDWLATYRRDRNLWEWAASWACPICTLFGSHARRGCARLTDLLPTSMTSTITLAHVSISRKLGKAEENLLFSMEAVDAGMKFKGLLVVAPPEAPPAPPCLAHVASSLQQVSQAAWQEGVKLLERILQQGELLLGGGKTRGYGYVKLLATRLYGDVSIGDTERPTS